MGSVHKIALSGILRALLARAVRGELSNLDITFTTTDGETHRVNANPTAPYVSRQPG